MPASVRPGSAPTWIGAGLMLLPLPAITATEAWELSGIGDAAQLCGLIAPAPGVALLVTGRLRKTVAAAGTDALPERFRGSPRLGWLTGWCATALIAGYLLMLCLGVGLLAVVGISALVAGSGFSIDDQPFGALGDGLMALVLSNMVAAVAWMVLAGLTWGILAAAHSLWQLASGTGSPNEKYASVKAVASGLLILGICATVVFGTARLPRDDVMLRGPLGTVGVLAVIAGIGLLVAVSWRRGYRPWGDRTPPGVPTGRFVSVLRAVLALILLGWMVLSIVSAWHP